MKILLVLHTPWTRELGLPRCSIELAREFRARGHEVEKFDLRDAFPRRTRASAPFEEALFSRRAVDFVRRRGRGFDVIQAEQGNLPVAKEELRFDGVLVCRSDGLVHFYEQWLRERPPPVTRARPGRRASSLLRSLAARLHGGLPAVDRSFDAADRIVLLNSDELRYVTDELGHGRKAVVLPNGLSEETFDTLAAAAAPPSERQRERQVVFLGHVNERKGLPDLPALVRHVRERVPQARFSLLGTAMRTAHMLELLDERDRADVRVVERFVPEELPGLLSRATVGVLPSYLEGFPLGALEQLAAGVPTVAYDVPGSRELLRTGPVSLTPAGDTRAMAEEVASILTLPQSDYETLVARSQTVAARYRWRDIASETLAVYEAARRELRSR